jgi:hypothetical protein
MGVVNLSWLATQRARELACSGLRLVYSVKTLYVDEGKTAEAVLADTLATSRYDCIMIGAGLLIVPPYFLLFEKLINVIHQHAPASTKLCFNTSPTDTAEAVRRWV